MLRTHHTFHVIHVSHTRESCARAQADLCVSEIVDVGLLGEFCLPTMQHARSELLNEGAKVIPCGATAYACLVQVERQPHALRRPLSQNPADEGGFDLTPFNVFASETRLGSSHWSMFASPSLLKSSTLT